MSETARPSAPYKGLMPYAEVDAPFFFGRRAEREIITANLMASRLTVLYGASGVGKSSVLRAGVSHNLRRLGRQNRKERGSPEFAVVAFSSWRDDPLARLQAGVAEAVTRALDDQTFEPLEPSPTLAQSLQTWAERAGGELFIILDQFEEYFLYHPREDGPGTFAVEFPRVVNRPDLRASFLLAIREDSLAKLDRFKGRIPNLFDNYLRIRHLDRDAARAAIERPIERYNELAAPDDPQMGIEPALVEAVLDQVRTGQVVLGEAGRGGLEDGRRSTESRIETPYLQLVMTRLWDEELRAGSRVLRLATLEQLGGAEQIVETHLDAAMRALPPSEQDAALQIFHHLVTPSGTKIAHTGPDLAEYAGLAQPNAESVLTKLSRPEVRILRPVAPPPDKPQVLRYEIFHDVLAPAILDWRARHVQARERAEAERKAAKQEREAARQRELAQARALAQEQERRAEAERQRAEEQTTASKRLRALAGGLAVVFLLAVGAAVVAGTQRQRALAEANARATEVVVRSQAEADALQKAKLAQDALSQLEAKISEQQTAAAAEAAALPTPRPTLSPIETSAPTRPSLGTPTATTTPTPNIGATETAKRLELELEQVRDLQTSVAQPVGEVIELRRIDIGRSVEGRLLSVTEVGGPSSRSAVVMVGNIQGDRASTRRLVESVVDYFDQRPQRVPDDVAFYFLPSLNPDGNAAGTRFNANGVDLNRNWDTDKWTPDPSVPGYLGRKPGAGGEEPFSEPETRAAADFISELKSQGRKVVLIGVYSTRQQMQVKGRVYPGGDNSREVARIYEREADYELFEDEASTATGEMLTWGAENGIPSIDVMFPDSQDPSSTVPGTGLTLQELTVEALLSVAESLQP